MWGGGECGILVKLKVNISLFHGFGFIQISKMYARLVIVRQTTDFKMVLLCGKIYCLANGINI